MQRHIVTASAAAVSLALAGCADFNTINRMNSLPSPAVKMGSKETRIEVKGADGSTTTSYKLEPSFVVDQNAPAPAGKAIHLDAPQRLAFVNALGKVCAEPSPDALQAFAASIGSSIITPGKSAEIAAALGTSAAGLGLRTQSITLMRDHMYRICEAHYNGGLSSIEMLQLLQRSQDLTLAVLAIEQLTGAVAARQPMLTSEARAKIQRDKVDDMLQAFEDAKKDEAAKLAARDKANAAVEEHEKVVAGDAEADKAAKAKAAPVKASIAKLKPQVAKEAQTLTGLGKVRDQAVTARDGRKVEIAKIEDAITKAKAANDASEVTKQTQLKQQAEAQLQKEEQKVLDTQKDVDNQKAVHDPLAQQLQAAEADKSLGEEKEAATKLAEDRKKLETAKAAQSVAKQDYADAQAVTEIRRAELASGKKSLEAYAKGSGSYAEPVGAGSNIDKDTVKHLADATTDIVEQALGKDRIVDLCFNLITSSTLNGISMDKNVLESCRLAIDARAKKLEAESKIRLQDLTARQAQTNAIAAQAQEIERKAREKGGALEPNLRLLQIPQLPRR